MIHSKIHWICSDAQITVCLPSTIGVQATIKGQWQLIQCYQVNLKTILKIFCLPCKEKTE